MYYFLLSCCLIENGFDERKEQYKEGINKVIKYTSDIKDKRIIIFENSGRFTESFLDDFINQGCEVFYTFPDISQIKFTENYGVKELCSLIDTINHYNIPDDGFIIKITGRYKLYEDSYFLEILRRPDILEKYDAILRYGAYYDGDFITLEKKRDCITGVIGMRAKYIKEIEKPEDGSCIEWSWAEKAMNIPDERVFIMDKKIGCYMPVNNIL
jgi:hypothetical protein